MYSRFSAKDTHSGVQIPEHYSGCAFSQADGRLEKPFAKSTSPLLEVARPTPTPMQATTHELNDPPQEKPATPSITSNSTHEQKQTDQKEAQPTAAVSLLKSPRLLGGLGSSFPFSHGIGFEELLILGLIFLLSQGETDSSTVLLLGLLLFCG